MEPDYKILIYILQIIYCMNSHRELEIGIVAYSPLGRGFFGGKGVEETMPNGSQLVMGQTTTISQSFFCGEYIRRKVRL